MAFIIVASLGVSSLPAGATQPDASAPVNCSSVPGSTTDCPSPPAQPGGLDHFLCYQVGSDQFTPPLVDVTDQFGVTNGVQPLSASSPHAWDNQLCNPVIESAMGRHFDVTGPIYGVGNAGAHLYCFTDSSHNSPSVNVSVQNEFGTSTFVVSRPTRLCLPSWKFDPNQDPSNVLSAGSTSPSAWTDPALLNLNHFQCYRLTSAEDVEGFSHRPRVVQLQDQFGTYSAFVGPAEELCAPAVKQVVSSTGSPIGASSAINSDGVDGAHLLCYGVFATNSRHAFGKNVSVGNQFSVPAASAVPNAVPVHVRYADQLCLPSFKSIIPPSQAPEVSSTLLLPLVGLVVGGGALIVVRRRRRLPAGS
jgi:hypothetical protein